MFKNSKKAIEFSTVVEIIFVVLVLFIVIFIFSDTYNKPANSIKSDISKITCKFDNIYLLVEDKYYTPNDNIFNKNKYVSVEELESIEEYYLVIKNNDDDVNTVIETDRAANITKKLYSVIKDVNDFYEFRDKLFVDTKEFNTLKSKLDKKYSDLVGNRFLECIEKS